MSTMAANKYPWGWRFRPKEKEKLTYLLYKVIGKPAPIDFSFSIDTVDVYGDKEPWEVFGDCKDDELYLFTRLKKKRNNGKCLRSVGKGTWNNKGKTNPIYNRRHQVIGYKKTYKYKCLQKTDHDGAVASGGSAGDEWLLKEYTLPDGLSKQLKKGNDYALCILKKKGHGVLDTSQEDGVTIDDIFDSILVEQGGNVKKEEFDIHCTKEGGDNLVASSEISPLEETKEEDGGGSHNDHSIVDYFGGFDEQPLLTMEPMYFDVDELLRDMGCKEEEYMPRLNFGVDNHRFLDQQQSFRLDLV